MLPVIISDSPAPAISVAHSAEHPSPSTVSPTSHRSPSSTMEFPQVARRQAWGAPAQNHPGSRVHALQPSPAVVLASSHPSSPSSTPLPHAMTHLDGSPVQA